MNTLFVLNILFSAMMTGLIWLIQLVHYPSFKFIHQSRFVEFEVFHSRMITYIVAPLMAFEIMIAGLLLAKLFSPLTVLCFVLVLLNWAVTAFLSVPCHQILVQHHDENIIDRLIKTNWIRTWGWTLKTIFSLLILI